MKKSLFIVLSFLLLVGCNETQKKYDKIAALLDTHTTLNLENIKQASSLLQEGTKFSPEQITELRGLFNEYINACALEQVDLIAKEASSFTKMTDVIAMQAKLDSISARTEQLKEYGIIISSEEGDLISSVSPMYVTTVFQNYLTEGEKRLARLQQDEIDNPTLSDAAIVIEYDELADRLFACEQMLDEFASDSAIVPQIELYRDQYMMLLMYGVDNTPAFDWRTKVLLSDVKTALENYTVEHPTTTSAKTIKAYLDVLVKTKYRSSKASKQFYITFEDNDLDTILH